VLAALSALALDNLCESSIIPVEGVLEALTKEERKADALSLLGLVDEAHVVAAAGEKIHVTRVIFRAEHCLVLLQSVLCSGASLIDESHRGGLPYGVVARHAQVVVLELGSPSDEVDARTRLGLGIDRVDGEAVDGATNNTDITNACTSLRMGEGVAGCAEARTEDIKHLDARILTSGKDPASNTDDLVDLCAEDVCQLGDLGALEIDGIGILLDTIEMIEQTSSVSVESDPTKVITNQDDVGVNQHRGKHAALVLGDELGLDCARGSGSVPDVKTLAASTSDGALSIAAECKEGLDLGQVLCVCGKLAGDEVPNLEKMTAGIGVHEHETGVADEGAHLGGRHDLYGSRGSVDDVRGLSCHAAALPDNDTFGGNTDDEKRVCEDPADAFHETSLLLI